MTAVLFAIVGAALLAWLIHRAGPDELWRVARPAAAWLPVVIGIEGVRIAIEAWGGQKLYAAPIRYARLLRATFVAYAVAALAPAGRASGEAVKAAMLRDRGGVEDTAAAATAIQTCSLSALGVWSAVAALMAIRVSMPLAATLAAQCALVLVGALVVHDVARASALSRAIARLWPNAARRVDRVRAHAAKHRLGRPLAAFVVSRGLELVQYGIVFFAVTGHFSIVSAVLTFGVATVGGTLGDSIPAQLGVLGASFSAAAGALGVSLPEAVAFGALGHVIQITWIAIGLLTPTLWRADDAGGRGKFAGGGGRLVRAR